MRKTFELSALVLATSVVLTAPAQAKRHSAEYRAAVRCNHGRVNSCLRRAALRHHVSYNLLHAIAWCESRLRPGVVNSSGHMGLMQFSARTFHATRYGSHYALSAKWNTLAGAWLISRGGTGPWAASRGCWA